MHSLEYCNSGWCNSLCQLLRSVGHDRCKLSWTCERFPICNDKMTENDRCVIKIIGIHWCNELNLKFDLLLELITLPFIYNQQQSFSFFTFMSCDILFVCIRNTWVGSLYYITVTICVSNKKKPTHVFRMFCMVPKLKFCLLLKI